MFTNLQIHSAEHLSTQLENRFDEQQISHQLFIKLQDLMADVSTFEARDFEEFDVEELYVYLKRSHKYYLDVWMPKLENTLVQLQNKCPEHFRSIGMLSLCLTAYKNELKAHIEQEEQLLFAFVDRLLVGKECEGLRDLVLNHFVHTHDDNIILELHNLKKEVLAMDAELEGNIILEILFNQLHIFQQDLKVHGLIEDEVFVQKLLAYKN